MATETESLVPPTLFPFHGNWDKYEEELYDIFKTTLTEGVLSYAGNRISIQRRPEHKGKHAWFWHLISEGEVEEERIPDMRRCERLHWVRWVIDNADTNDGIHVWENIRGRDTHVVLWYKVESYAVILAKRNGYYMIKSAYVLTGRRTNSFQKEWDDYKSKSKP